MALGQSEMRELDAPNPLSAVLSVSGNFMHSSLFDNIHNFHERYAAGKTLGRGENSIVKRCVEKSTDLEFAAKIIDYHADTGCPVEVEENYHGMLNELAVLRILSGHDNIVKLHNAYQSPTTVILIFDICKKGDLFDYMTEIVTLSENQARCIMKQLFGVVAYMHKKNIVHRDLKPENILLDDQLNIKVTDFGFAALVPGDNSNVLADLFGTPGYLAPEVLKLAMSERKHLYGKPVDLWACGVIMYSLLAGYPPFIHRKQGTMLRNIVEGKYSLMSPEWDIITSAAKYLIKRLLTLDPSERITAEEALQHDYFQVLLCKNLKGIVRRKLKRTMAFVRAAVRISRLHWTPEQMPRDPFVIRQIRKSIDSKAFYMYGYSERRGTEPINTVRECRPKDRRTSLANEHSVSESQL